MNNLFKGLISGYGAYKLGGGCLGTIVFLWSSGLYLGNVARNSWYVRTKKLIYL